MKLACLFIISVLSLASLGMSRVEASRDHPAKFHPKHRKKIVASLEDAWKEEEEEDKGGGFSERIVRRAVRKVSLLEHSLRNVRCGNPVWGPWQLPPLNLNASKWYPEDAGDHVEAGHRQLSIPMGRAEGSCPEVLAKGTLAVIVAALAFLGFFSTSVLLVVAVCVLRVVHKQRKTGKEGKTNYPPSRRLPPIPPPRPERTYMNMKPHGSDRLRPATPHTAEDTYLSVNELNPGPRTHQNHHYHSLSASSPPKTPMEREYIIPEKVQHFSSPPSAKKYVNVEESEPTAVTGGSPEIGMTPQGRDNHIYEEVE